MHTQVSHNHCQMLCGLKEYRFCKRLMIVAITTCQGKIEYHGKCDLDISVRYIMIYTLSDDSLYSINATSVDELSQIHHREEWQGSKLQ